MILPGIDHNRNGKVDIADAIWLLNMQYRYFGPTATYELNCSNNPFAGSYIIVGVPKNGDETVTLTIYDREGRLLRTLLNKVMYPARHVLLWDGKDDEGVEQTSGLYPCKMTAGDLEIEGEALFIGHKG